MISVCMKYIWPGAYKEGSNLDAFSAGLQRCTRSRLQELTREAAPLMDSLKARRCSMASASSLARASLRAASRCSAAWRRASAATRARASAAACMRRGSSMSCKLFWLQAASILRAAAFMQCGAPQRGETFRMLASMPQDLMGLPCPP